MTKSPSQQIFINSILYRINVIYPDFITFELRLLNDLSGHLRFVFYLFELNIIKPRNLKPHHFAFTKLIIFNNTKKTSTPSFTFS